MWPSVSGISLSTVLRAHPHAACGRASPLFVAAWCSVCGGIYVPVHLVDGHLACFHLSAAVNPAVIYINLQIFV